MDVRILLHQAIMYTWRGREGSKVLMKVDLSNSESSKDAEALLEHFCFPEPVVDHSEVLPGGSQRCCISELRPGGTKHTFAFAIVGPRGERKHGLAMRYIRAGNVLPECICLTSGVPWFEFLGVVLHNMQKIVLCGDSHIVEGNLEPHRETFLSLERYLKGLCLSLAQATAVQTLRGGQLVQTDGTDSKCGLFKSELRVPMDRGMGMENACIDLIPLLWQLPPEKVVFLIGALLLEKRIIMVSSNVELLSSCIYICNALMYPFEWRHVFLPILPMKFSEYLSAPVPFLMGVPRAVWDQVQGNTGTLSAIVVDLDNGNLAGESQGHTFRSMPELSTIELVRQLKAVASSLSGPTAEVGSLANENVASALAKFYANLFGSYRRYIRNDPYGRSSRKGTTNEREGYWFDYKGFLQAQSKDNFPFLSSCCETQCFEKFIYDRLDQVNSDFPDTSIFESEVSFRLRKEARSTICRGNCTVSWQRHSMWSSISQPRIDVSNEELPLSTDMDETPSHAVEKMSVCISKLPDFQSSSLLDMDMPAPDLSREDEGFDHQPDTDPGKYLSKLLGLG